MKIGRFESKEKPWHEEKHTNRPVINSIISIFTFWFYHLLLFLCLVNSLIFLHCIVSCLNMCLQWFMWISRRLNIWVNAWHVADSKHYSYYYFWCYHWLSVVILYFWLLLAFCIFPIRVWILYQHGISSIEYSYE